MATRNRADQVEALREHHMYRGSEGGIDNYRSWITCRCGYVVDLPGSGNIPDTDRAKLNHLLDVLDSLT